MWNEINTNNYNVIYYSAVVWCKVEIKYVSFVYFIGRLIVLHDKTINDWW